MEKIKKISNWEVMTPTGWQSFEGIKETKKSYTLKVTLADGKIIECSGGHQLYVKFLDTGEEGFLVVDLLEPFKYSVLTDKDDEYQRIFSINKISEEKPLYDLINVSNGYEYYTNGILSHNCAHIENLEELWLGLKPTLSTGGRAIMFSSPKGKNFFYQLWMGADTNEYEKDRVGLHCTTVGKNGFHGIKLPWTVHPERDDKWFEEESRAMSSQGIAQELLCVGPQSRIQTFDGFKFASDISIGDMVLTHKGRFKPVINVGHRPVGQEENVYQVSVPCNREEDLLITGNHPLYGKKFHCTSTLSPWKKIIDEGIKSDFYSLDEIDKFQKTYADRFFASLQPANYINNIIGKITDKIDLWSFDVQKKKMMPDGKISYWRQRSETINRTVDINFDLGRYIGLCVAEGCINKNYSKGRALTENLQLAFHTNELDTLGKFITDFYDKLGVKYCVNIRSYSKCFTVHTSNKYIIELYRNFVNTGDATKKYLKFDTFLSTNIDFIKGYLVGHFDGDGDRLEAASSNNFGKKIKVVTRSPKLLGQIKILLAAFGHYGRINYKTGYYELDGVDLLPSPTILEALQTNKTSLEKVGSRTKLINDEIIGNIQYKRFDKEKCPIVYNIEVEEDHSYIVNGVTVHNCSFESSALTFFSQADIDYVRNLSYPPIGYAGPNGKGNDMHIWKTPIPEHKYVIAADVARGDAEDYSTFHIFDTNESEVVAEYMGKIAPDRFGEFLIEIGKKYNDALIVNEKNTVGIATAIKLRDSEYKNVYYDPDLAEKMVGMTPDEKKDILPGFTITSKNREPILENLEQVIRNHQIKIYSLRFVEQMETFIWNGKRGQALKKRHDDLILAMGVGLQIFTPSAAQQGYLGMMAANQTMANSLLAGMSRGYKDIENKFQGKKLPHGVNKNAVKFDSELKKEFWWMFR
jgi:hypothetical protein